MRRLLLGLVLAVLGGCARPSAVATPADTPAGRPPMVAAAPGTEASGGYGLLPEPLPAPVRSPTPLAAAGLAEPRKKEIAMELVSSAENSGLNWRAYYKYIEDIGDGRGYTAGIIGFCSGTGDMLQLVQRYTAAEPGNALAKYLPALKSVNGSDSHDGLDPAFTADWARAAADPAFQRAQDAERDTMYFDPAVAAAHQDGLRALGQFIYYDATVMHGADGLARLRKAASGAARTPAEGGDEVAYLNTFLDARVALMRKEQAHHDTTRVDTEQRVFLTRRNLDLVPPLAWKVYDTPFAIAAM